MLNKLKETIAQRIKGKCDNNDKIRNVYGEIQGMTVLHNC